MNELEEVSAKIRELVPRLMELSLGCEFIGTQMQSPSKINCIARGYVQLIGKTDVKVDEFYDKLERGVYRIIGHPISLEDVLEAIGTTLKGKEVNCMNFWVSEHGKLSHSKDFGIWDWEYGKPFSKQNPEVITFLHKLLCQN